MSKRTNAFAERIAALDIDATAAEVASVIKRPVEDVEAWLDGAEPDAEALVLLRIFDEPHIGKLQIERVRHTYVRNQVGDGATQSGVTPPYGGGFAGTDAGRPE